MTAKKNMHRSSTTITKDYDDGENSIHMGNSNLTQTSQEHPEGVCQEVRKSVWVYKPTCATLKGTSISSDSLSRE